MERMLIEYAINAAWQLPVLAAGAWLLVRVSRLGAAAQHRIWVGVLALAVVLPMAGVLADAGAGHGVGGGFGRPSGQGLAAVRVEVAPARDAGTAGKAGSDVRSGNAANGSALAADNLSQIGEPSGPVLGSLGARHGSSWAGWGVAALEHVRRIELSATAAEWIAGAYLLVMLLGLMRIVRAWNRARSLARDSDANALTDGERALVEECARRMGLPEPEVRVVDDADALAGPVVVGAARPVLLCPEGFVRELLQAGREDEATAALCHEMAHIRRRDYAMNLVCEAMAVPLKWHPVTYGVERRIWGTREMACDAMAAQAMKSDAEYARCLVGLAERMVAGGLAAKQAGAVGLFSGNALEERVVRLMETGKAMSARTKVVRGVAGVAAMTAAVALAVVFHVVPARAQTAAKDKVVAPATVAGPATLRVVKPVVAAGPVVVVAKDKVIQPKIIVGKELPQVVVVGNSAFVAPRVLLMADAQAGKNSVPEVIELAKPEQKVNVRVLTPVHGVVKVSKLTPVAPMAVPVIALDPAGQVQATPTPASSIKPAPKAAPAPKKEPLPHEHVAIVSKDGKTYAWVDGQERELTPAERAQLEKQIEDAEKKIAAETARINSPEFREQIEKAEQEARDAERKLQSGEIQKELAEAQKRMDSPEFKEQLTEAQKKAMADEQRDLNSAAFQAKMAEAQKGADEAVAKLQSPEFKQQMEEAQQKALSNADLQRQMAEAQKELAAAMTRVNSPEFKAQMEKEQREVEQLDNARIQAEVAEGLRKAMETQRKLMNGEIQKQMAEAQKELQKQLDELKAADISGVQKK